MSETTKVSVETSSPAPAPVVHAPAGRFHFLKVLCAVYLSRKFVMVATVFWIIWRVHWNLVSAIFTFENADQLHAFTTITGYTMGTLGAIALGYLGFSRTSQGMSSYIPQIGGGFQSGPPVNRSWKADPNDR